jgi:predicted DNA-binding transcriptional regulator AlpA
MSDNSIALAGKKRRRPQPRRRIEHHRSAAQVEPSKKAAAMKDAADEKRPQPSWLQRPTPPLESEAPPVPERAWAATLWHGPPRLLDKAEVCAIANVTFPTVWAWMRAQTFPRSRVVGGKSMWLSTEVEAWLAALPVRRLKGDGEAA